MKKILSIALISSLALMFSTGCSTTSASPDAQATSETMHLNTPSDKSLICALKKAAQKTGWNITDFKTNEVIAEKTDDGKTVASSVKFNSGDIEFENAAATSDLREALEKELANSSSQE